MQADALEIEALAKRRLADEYDAAQTRGEIAKRGINQHLRGMEEPAHAKDVGLSHREVHEARQIREAETRDPGIVRRTVDAAVKARGRGRNLAGLTVVALKQLWVRLTFVKNLFLDLDHGLSAGVAQRENAQLLPYTVPMQRDTLYFRLSLVWLAILVGGLLLVLFI
jgi:hypothetical protein